MLCAGAAEDSAVTRGLRGNLWPRRRGKRPSSLHDLAQQIVSGLATGSIFASVALALVLIYRAMGIINFAQGEMAMFTTYIAWQLV